MWRMLQIEAPKDFVIATGETHRLQDFVDEAFAAVGLGWRAHVQTDAALIRPTDIRVSRANPEFAATQLGWRAHNRMRVVVRAMVATEQAPSPKN